MLLNETISKIRNPVALAIFTHLNTKPDNWQISPEEIMSRFDIGRDRYLRAMKELRALGLLTLERFAGGRGEAKGSSYTLHYEPQLGESGNTTVEKSDPQGYESQVLRPSKVTTVEKSDPLQTKERRRRSQTKESLQTKEVTPGAAPPTAPVWSAYSEAYRERYGVVPIRNARINGQLAQLVQRVGKDMAPLVAAYYLTSNRQFYVARGHQVGPMLSDAEQLAAEVNGAQRTTATQARNADRHQAQGDVFRRLLARAEA